MVGGEVGNDGFWRFCWTMERIRSMEWMEFGNREKGRTNLDLPYGPQWPRGEQWAPAYDRRRLFFHSKKTTRQWPVAATESAKVVRAVAGPPSTVTGQSSVSHCSCSLFAGAVSGLFLCLSGEPSSRPSIISLSLPCPGRLPARSPRTSSLAWCSLVVRKAPPFLDAVGIPWNMTGHFRVVHAAGQHRANTAATLWAVSSGSISRPAHGTRKISTQNGATNFVPLFFFSSSSQPRPQIHKTPLGCT